MTLHSDSKISKASRNYFYNLFSFSPFVFLLFTGLVVLRYHSGEPYETLTFGINGNLWLLIHRITALAIVPVIGIHLWMHKHWLKKAFRIQLIGKNSGMTLTLFIIFLMCVITGFLAWFVFEGKSMEEVLREVHNKLGLLLIFFFVFHISNHMKWLAIMTRKHFIRKNQE